MASIKKEVVKDLKGILAASLKMPQEKIAVDEDFSELGIDSILVMDIIEAISRCYTLNISPAKTIHANTVLKLSELLISGYEKELTAYYSKGDTGGGGDAPSKSLIDEIFEKYKIDLKNDVTDPDNVDEIVDILVEKYGDTMLSHYQGHNNSLVKEKTGEMPRELKQNSNIAVIGMSSVFPDAPDPDSLWENLINGKNSIREIPVKRFQRCGCNENIPGEEFVRYGALLDDIDLFDPLYFKISPKEARLMDPQERMVLQEAYKALEDAGIQAGALKGTGTGVFIGYEYTEYLDFLKQKKSLDGHDDIPLYNSSNRSYYLANRISYTLDLRGPSEAINTNCAASAVAVNRAYYALLNRECDLAIVGGVCLHLFKDDYIASAGALSPDGSCKVFDEYANGYARGEGCGMIILKRIEDAEKAGDPIRGVIKSSFQNNRGQAKSLRDINPGAITDVIERCYERVSVNPGTVRYIEVHGYATKWGDSLEYDAVKKVFYTGKGSGSFHGKYCGLGSIKGNLGNLEPVSGIAGIIKILLSLMHKKFPATIGCKTVNKFIDISEDSHPLYILDKNVDFSELDINEGVPVRAGINSFADSGVNVHILLEEYHPRKMQGPPAAGGEELVVLSAKNNDRLREYASAYISFLKKNTLFLSDIAYTLQVGREAMESRLAIIVKNRDDFILGLEKFINPSAKPNAIPLFTGNPGAGPGGPGFIASYPGKDRAELAGHWLEGGEVAWESLYEGRSVKKVSLPTYPFAKERYWISGNKLSPSPLNPEWKDEMPKGDSLTPGNIRDYILRILSDELNLPGDQIPVNENIRNYGADSIVVLKLIRGFESRWRIKIKGREMLEHQTVEDLSAHLFSKIQTEKNEAASVHFKKSKAPLSEGQKGLWVLQKMYPEMGAYNLPLCFRINQKFDAGALKESFRIMLEQHPVLTTKIIEKNGIPFQIRNPGLSPDFREEDISRLKSVEIIPYIKKRAKEPFFLTEDPLMRVSLFSRAPSHSPEKESILLITIHHIIFDGISLKPFIESLFHNYRALVHGGVPEVMPSETDYSDFVEWEREMLNGTEGGDHRAYWKEQLTGNLPSLEFYPEKSFFPGPLKNSKKFEGGTCTSPLSPELVRQIKSFAISHQVNLSTLFLGIFKVLLFRYTGQEDLIVGMPVTVRPREEFDHLIGYFINMIAVRSQGIGTGSFLDFLRRLQLVVIDGIDHGEYPFPALVRELKGPRTEAGAPVFQAAFAYHNLLQGGHMEVLKEQYDDILSIEPVEEIDQEGEYQLELEVLEKKEGFVLNLKYGLASFDPSSIRMMMKHYIKLMEGILEAPAMSPGEYSLLTLEEHKTLVYKWNDTKTDYPSDKCFHELFEEQVRRTPLATAVAFENKSLTYSQLDEKSTKLAAYIQARGGGPGFLAGICVNRSFDMITGMLAVLKSGSAYVPLDPEYPDARLGYMIRDSKMTFILTQSGLKDKVSSLIEKDTEMIFLDKEWENNGTILKRNVMPGDLAYVIYTSGSTGNPKGVMIPHRALTNFLVSMGDKPGMAPGDKLLALTTFCFDIAALELFLPLMNGAVCVICNTDKVKNAEKLKLELKRVKPTIVQATPATWKMLFHAGWRNEEKIKILCGGEALSEGLKRNFMESGSEVWNMFGPTETTIWSTVRRIREREPITIGRPIANTQIYILDNNKNLSPVSIPGELCIAGDGLAKGYLNRPELTAEKFVDNPFDPGRKLYRTGDLARWISDEEGMGQVDFLGRMDDQVKIRGFRIELGDIEVHLNSFSAIESCVVVAREQEGHKQLIAYYVPEVKGGVDPKQLPEFLKSKLPVYMIPARFIELESIPLTQNGKVNRKELRTREVTAPRDISPSVPFSAMEQKIASLWKEVLNIDEVDREDGFFDVGGDSVLAAIVSERIGKEFQCDFTVISLFKYSNIKEISKFIAESGQRESLRPDNPVITAGTDQPDGCPDYYRESLAIIGISCHFPGAENHWDFWYNLREGRESVSFFSGEELSRLGLPEKMIKDPSYVPVRSTIDGKELFDPEFFNISPRDAELMEPQFRLLLLHSWKALEDAGYTPEQVPETSVFISSSNMLYQTIFPNVASNKATIVKSSDEYVTWLLSQGGTIPTMISHKLGLKGASFSVHSNCSSSLVGLYSAYRSLISGDAKYSLVGASTLFPSPSLGYMYKTGLNFSSDGRIKAFDESADGMIGGEGVAVVLLKRAIDAVKDGDHIYSLLRGIGVNNDGADKIGFYAPSIKGQSEVIQRVLDSTKIHPESVSYIEAHGTGTKLGDPVEVEALNDAYKRYTAKRQYCGIGSVKTNIGHLDTAAGLAGCIKVALSLYHNEIPPSLNYKEPNPKINFDGSPFYVVDRLKPLEKREQPHRAGLSSFGIGGTNTHAIFEQYAPVEETGATNPGPFLFPLSAKNEERLKDYALEVLRFLKSDREFAGRLQDENRDIEKVLRQNLILVFSTFTNISGEEISPEQNFSEMNIDPVVLTTIFQHLQDKWEMDISQDIVFQCRSIDDLTSFLMRHHQSHLKIYFKVEEPRVTYIRDVNLADLVYTFQTGRRAMESRVVFIVTGKKELIRNLEAFIDDQADIEGCFTGKAGSVKGPGSPGDPGPEEPAVMHTSMKDLKEFAKLWARGGSPDWDRLYSGLTPRRISSPTYPFAREQYKLAGISRRSGDLPEEKTGHPVLHPLLHFNTSSFSEQRFSSVFTGREFFLADHIVNGRRILPGVAYLEMACKAFLRSVERENVLYDGRIPPGGLGVRLRNVIWIRPVVMDEDVLQVHTGLFPGENGKVSYEIYTLPGGDGSQPVIHSQGEALLAPLPEVDPVDISALSDRFSEARFSSEECYGTFKAGGFNYGPGFRGIVEITKGSGQLLAKLSLPTVPDTRGQFLLHPGMMDSAIQASIGFVLGVVPINEMKTTVPFALEKLDVYGPCTREMWALIRYAGRRGARLERFDIDLFDQDGQIRLRLKGFTSKESIPPGAPETREFLMLQPVEEERAVEKEAVIPGYKRHLIFLCEPGDISRNDIEARIPGSRCIILKSGEKGIDKRFESYAVRVFNEVHHFFTEKNSGGAGKPASLIQLAFSGRKEQQVFRGLSGLLKTASMENPSLTIQMLEVDNWGRIKELLRENMRMPHERYLRYNGGKRWVEGWKEIVPSTVNMPWKEQGVYLITGGAGALGLHFAAEISRRVRSAVLVLTGRSRLGPDKRNAIEKFNSPGIEVEYRQVDTAEKRALGLLVQDILNSRGKIDGVIHGAGVIHDNFIIRKNEREFKDVLAPKVSGLVNLDEATREIPLDFFILFSSVSGVLGSLGQGDYAAGNAFMDSYSLYRNTLVALNRRQGKTLSINWPYWKEGGMTLDEEFLKKMEQKSGVLPLETLTGIRALYLALASGNERVMVLEGIRGPINDYVRSSLTTSPAAAEKSGIKREVPGQTDVNGVKPEPVSINALRDRAFKVIKDTLIDVVKLPPAKIEPETNFERYGIDSILQVNVIDALEKIYGELPKTLLFEYTNITELVDYFMENHGDKFPGENLISDKTASGPVRETAVIPRGAAGKRTFLRRGDTTFSPLPDESGDIAIIGVSGRYPMSNTLEELWEHLKAGDNCITRAPESRWRSILNKSLYGGDELYNPNNGFFGGYLDAIDRFDHRLFDIERNEVFELSPESRLFLEVVWETFERAGYNRSGIRDFQSGEKSGIGVFVGTMYTQYAWSMPTLEQAALFSNDGDWPVANRASYLFNLTGPSIMISSACSSSLTAVHLACESLKQNSCSMAIAGGVNLTLNPSKFAALRHADFLGSGNLSKSFGNGDGYIPGEGVGAVLLKPLSKALADKDPIIAVIKSSFVNHSGGRQVYSAPDPKQQTRLIIDAMQRAGINPATIGYVESAANGSALGDPIEVVALNKAFKPYIKKKQSLAIGSVKSNLGHLEAASGISQLTKVLLQLKHGTLVPSINANPGNPNIKMEQTAFYIQEETAPWPRPNDPETGKEAPRRSMINSFGAGGSYANIIVEEFIDKPVLKSKITPSHQESLFVFSAKTEWSFFKYLEKMEDFFKKNPSVNIEHTARCLQKINHGLEYRGAVIASSYHEIVEKIRNLLETGSSQAGAGIYLSPGPGSNPEPFRRLYKPMKPGETDLGELAEYWTRGAPVDFKALYANEEVPAVDLPCYSFDHGISFSLESSPIDDLQEVADEFYPFLLENLAARKLSAETALQLIRKLGVNMDYQKLESLFENIENQQVDTDTGIKEFLELKKQRRPAPGAVDVKPELYDYDEPFLKDHTVYDEQMLIGMTHGCLALTHFFKFFPGEKSVDLRKLSFVKPVVVKKDRSVEVLVKPVIKESAADFDVVYRESPASGWELTATGRLEKSLFEIGEFDLEGLKGSLEPVENYNGIYTVNPPVRLGESFRTVTALYKGDDMVLAHISLGRAILEEKHEYILHPLIIHSAYVALAPLLEPLNLRHSYLPFGIKDIRFIKTGNTDSCWLTVKLVKYSDEMITFDAEMITEDSRVAACFTGCSLKRLRNGKRENNTGPELEPKKIPEVNSVEVFQDEEGLAGKIQKYLIKKITGIVSDDVKITNVEVNIMDLGMESARLISLTDKIEQETGVELFPTLFFEYPNIKELTGFFIEEHGDQFRALLGNTRSTGRFRGSGTVPVQVVDPAPESIPPQKRSKILRGPGKFLVDDEIAVIGMSGRFGESSDLDRFWEILSHKRNVVKEVPVDHWDYRPWYDKNRDARDKTYCKWGSFLNDIDKFDAEFFSISPREANWMDPQLRIMLENIYSTGEDAGCMDRLRSTNTGIFIGSCNHDYANLVLGLNLPMDPYFGTGNSQTVIANRASFIFDFKGPSIAFHTECSSVLFALHAACQALYNKECDAAFVGGVNLLLSSLKFRYFSSIGALSPTGRCHTFDESADGYVPGECVASILLKPLKQAEKDGDHIYGLIKGSAALHGGYTPSLTAPSVEGESNVIIKAWEDAGIDPGTLTYIEAHGTGTKLGDPIEIDSLKRAFKKYTTKEKFCAVGSVKSNIGHTEGAAGIAGIIKALLQLKHRQIPAMPGFNKLNPYIRLEKSPLYLNRELEEWKSPPGVPRRAGISSFGFSGAYAHAVIEEYIPKNKAPHPSTAAVRSPGERENVIIVLSARNKERLHEKVKQLLEVVRKREYSGIHLTDIAYTLQTGREVMEERLALIINSVRELEEKLALFINKHNDIDDLYQGQVEGNKELLGVLTADEDMAKTVDAWIAKRKYGKLLDLWVKGLNFNWNKFYNHIEPGLRPRRISLPAYPFSKERYWIAEIAGREPGLSVNAESPVLHPLLHRNTSHFYEQRFSSTFTGHESFLADHVINGRSVLPGVAYLEMVRIAVDLAAGGGEKENKCIRIEKVAWIRPLVVENEPVLIHIGLLPAGEDSIRFEVYREIEGERMVHCRGSAVVAGEAGNEEVLDPEVLKKKFSRYITDRELFYKTYREIGVEYGPGHRGVEKIYATPGTEGPPRILVELLFSSLNEANPFVLHPGLMDSAVQATAGLMMMEESSTRNEASSGVSLPFALEELEITGKCTPRMWARIICSDENLHDLQKVDIDLCDEAGRICVRMKGFTSRLLNEENRAFDEYKEGAGAEILMLKPQWEVRELKNSAGDPGFEDHLLVLAGADPRFSRETFKGRIKGARCLILPPGQEDAAGKFKTLTLRLFEEIRNLFKKKPGGRAFVQLVVNVEDGHQFLTGLLALLKSARQENPNLAIQLMQIKGTEDINEIIERIIRNRQNPDADHIRYEEGKRFVHTWKEIEFSPGEAEKADLPWRDDGVYLITGGSGGLGLLFAREIAGRTQKARVILSGRSPLDDTRRSALTQLNALGISAEYRQADIADNAAAAGLIDGIVQEFGQLHGILHAAGVIRDGFIIKKREEDLKAVLAPKVSGLLNLDRAAGDLNLDFFIFFSSAAGALGSLGQAGYSAANAFMDAYSVYRNALRGFNKRHGLTLSINWPLWLAGGMHVDTETEKRMWKEKGIVPMPSAVGLKVFYQCLASGEEQVLVLSGDAERLKKSTEPGLPPVFKSRVPETAVNTTVPGDLLRERVFIFIKKILAEKVQLAPEKIKPETPFEKYGVDSILQLELIQEFEKVYGNLSKTLLFEYTNTKELLDYFLKNHPEKHAVTDPEPLSTPGEPPAKDEKTSFAIRKNRFEGLQALNNHPGKTESGDIAVIGVSGRYPLSNSLEVLWEHLKAGDNCITPAPPERWETTLKKALYGPGSHDHEKIFYGGFLDKITHFDHHLFGVDRQMVLDLTPELRLFLEIVWEAFEDAGYTRALLEDAQNGCRNGIGVFAGTMYSQYPWNIPSFEQAELAAAGTDWQIANRVSHFFDLTGPSLMVNTACSSSLSAIHFACESLKQESCSMAIAGGINLTLNPSKYDLLHQVDFLGSSGKSKSFGAGDGYIPGEGVGAVLLKPLSGAVKEGDHIYGVIKSSFVNHSGGRQAFGAPDPKRQTELIVESIKRSGIDPETINYVESAANGSPLGDPVEVLALNNAFQQYTGKKQYCALGAVKSNIGHLEAASGISQLTKIILQLKYKTLVPTINAFPLNSNINLIQTPFFIQEKASPWEQVKDKKTGKRLPKRSMINSFGAGGAFANLIVEEFINDVPAAKPPASSRKDWLFIFSAKTKWSLFKYLEKFQTFLEQAPPADIGSIAGALQRMNHGLEYRAAVIAGSYHGLVEKMGLLREAVAPVEDSGIFLSGFNDPGDGAFHSLDIDQIPGDMSLGELAGYWVAGFDLRYGLLYDKSPSDRVNLPAYAFDHNIDFDFEGSMENVEFYENIFDKITDSELSDKQFEQLIKEKLSYRS